MNQDTQEKLETQPAFSFFELDEDDVPSRSDCIKHGWQNYDISMKLNSAVQALYNNVDGIGNGSVK